MLEILSKDELKRQELIFELIYTEEQYIKDLNLVVNVCAPNPSFSSFPLLPFDIALSSFLQSFLLPLNQISSLEQEDIDLVFAGIEDIISINDAFSSDLRERQRQSVVVEQIGDILLRRAESFQCYANYIGERTRGDYQLAVISRNPQVAAVLKV